MDRRNFFVVGIGASAGGHHALKEFFLNIPSNSGMAFCVITHLLRSHPSILHNIISKYTGLPVKRMKGYDIVQPNMIYVMPENVKAFMKNGALVLKPRPKDELVNTTIDEFFHSLAKDFREKSIGIVMSGMGSDGSKGIESIHEFGGIVMVQEPHSTMFKSMPDTVIKRDHPDRILPPALLAKNLMKVAKEREVDARGQYNE